MCVLLWANPTLKTLILQRFLNKVVLCLDNDGDHPKSDQLIQAAAENLLQEGKQVWIAKPPEAGQDYNDVLKLQGIESVQKGLHQAIPYAHSINPRPAPTHLKSLLDTADCNFIHSHRQALRVGYWGKAFAAYPQALKENTLFNVLSLEILQHKASSTFAKKVQHEPVTNISRSMGEMVLSHLLFM